MSLDLTRLEQVKELANGVLQARCPACAEAGGDRKGQHLRVYADGRFGCCVHPQEREHRRRIHALAGAKATPQRLVVRVAAAQTGRRLQGGILGRLARVFESPSQAGSPVAPQRSSSDASDGVHEVRPQPEAQVRTPRTGAPESSREEVLPQALKKSSDASDGVHEVQPGPEAQSRTLRTGLDPGAYREEFDDAYTYKGSGPPVRSVRKSDPAEPECPKGVRGVREGGGALGTPKNGGKQGEKLPYVTADGTLVIPFDSPERYHWWKGGQSVAETLAEIRNPKAEDQTKPEQAEQEQPEMFYGDAD